MERPFLADSLGFLAPQGEPPIADPDLVLDLVHITAAPPWLTSFKEVFEAVQKTVKCIADQPNLRLVRTKADLDLPGTKVILGLQNPIDSVSHDDWLALYELGIRVSALAYDKANMFGGGFKEPLVQLTNEGGILLEVLHDVGIICDLSHAGHQTARDSVGPTPTFMASHTGSYNIFPHIRNLPDDVLKGIAEAGGVVGVYTLTFGLHQSEGGFEKGFLPHLKHIMEVCGDDSVCIGSDGVHREVNLAAAQAKFNELKAKLDPDGLFDVRFPDQHPDFNSPRRAEILSEKMAGYELDLQGERLKKISGLNFLNFLRRALPE